MTPTHVDKPLIHKPEEKLRFAAPTVRVVVGVVLDCHEQFFLLEVGQYPVDGRGSTADRPSSSPKPGRNMPVSSRGAIGTRPSCLPRAKSSLPHPGAMCTMPVPSASLTASHGITLCISRAAFAGPHFCFTATSAISAEKPPGWP